MAINHIFRIGTPIVSPDIVSVGAQQANGDINVVYTLDAPAAVTVEVVVFYDTGTLSDDITAADFNGGGAADYVDQGTIELPTSNGNIELTITGTWNPTTADVIIGTVPVGGSTADIELSPAFTLDTTAPTVSSLSPADNAPDVAVDAPLVMTFSKSMKRQGDVTAIDASDDSTIYSYDLSTDGTWSTVSETDDRWTGPTPTWDNEVDVEVHWEGLEDTKGNALADNTGDAAWNFGVAAAASGITLIESQQGIVLRPSLTTVTFVETLQENDIVAVYRLGARYSTMAAISGYTNIVEGATWGSTGVCIRADYKRMGSTPDTSVVIPFREVSGNGQVHFVRVYRGIDPTTALDVAALVNTSSPSTASISPPSITTATDNARVVVLAGQMSGSGTVAITDYPAGYGDTAYESHDTTWDMSAGIAEKVISPEGLEDMGTFEFAASNRCNFATLAWRPAT